MYRAAADALALIHLCYIIFVVAGGLLVLRWRWVMALHLPATVWAVLIEVAEWPCPLTKWENLALERAGEPAYGGGFIAHYLFRVIYPRGLTRRMEIVLAIVVVVVNAIVYSIVIARSGRRAAPSAAGRG
ncbi:MAG TPA: DUF2784 domain-containing protein [Thermoanaerobaculia bacterium]|nr:DUF2784 domain-containing protein [Thermoanaerobaculia bacterium]